MKNKKNWINLSNFYEIMNVWSWDVVVYDYIIDLEFNIIVILVGEVSFLVLRRLCDKLGFFWIIWFLIILVWFLVIKLLKFLRNIII